MARPTKYKKEYAQLAYNYCLLGATDVQLAAYFDVEEKTINNWKKSQPQFLQSLKDGKAKADANVALSLYQRATGYSHTDTDIRVIDGEIYMTEIMKHYPPDSTSMIFWLKNRQQDWKDKQTHEVEMPEGVNFNFHIGKK